MYTFLHMYALPRLTNEEQESLGRLTRNMIKLVIKYLRQSQDTILLLNYLKHLKKNQYQNGFLFSNPYQKIGNIIYVCYKARRY